MKEVHQPTGRGGTERATNHPCLNSLTTIDQYIIHRPMSWEIPQPLFPLPDLGGITASQTKVGK